MADHNKSMINETVIVVDSLSKLASLIAEGPQFNPKEEVGNSIGSPPLEINYQMETGYKLRGLLLDRLTLLETNLGPFLISNEVVSGQPTEALKCASSMDRYIEGYNLNLKISIDLINRLLDRLAIQKLILPF